MVLCQVLAALEHTLQRTLASTNTTLLMVPTLNDAAAWF
jgi:hypothetical protein